MFEFSLTKSRARPEVVEILRTDDLPGTLRSLPTPTVSDSGDKNDDAPLIALGRFTEGKRATEDTWHGAQCVMLDIDGGEGTPPFEEAVRRARELGYSFIAGPSARNTPAVPRYRFLFLLAAVAKSPMVFRETAKHLALSLQIVVDTRSYVPSQRWYTFNPVVEFKGLGVPLQFEAMNTLPSPKDIAGPLSATAPGERRTTLVGALAARPRARDSQHGRPGLARLPGAVAHGALHSPLRPPDLCTRRSDSIDTPRSRPLTMS